MARTSRRARRTSHLYMPSAFDLFTPSKDLVLKNIWIFGPLYAVPLVFYIHSWVWSPLPHQQVSWWHHADFFSSAWPGSTTPTYPTFLLIGFSILWLIIIGVVGTIVQIMANAAQLEASAGRRLDFSDLWQVVKQFGWRLLGLYVVMAVLITIGFFLVIIPGLLLLRRFFFAPYVMIEKQVSISEALSRSAAIGKTNTGAVWGIITVMILIGLVNIVPWIGGLASFALGSLYSVAPAMRYQQLKKLA